MSEAATQYHVRPARTDEWAVCADILYDWIDARGWMPLLYSRAEVHAFYRDTVFAQRDVFAVGEPLVGFMAIDADTNQVTALYTATPGRGIGKALLDHAKEGRAFVELWTFQANAGARAFYEREGFVPMRTTEGDNDEGLADVLLRWEAS